jgi:hypothetical protein
MLLVKKVLKEKVLLKDAIELLGIKLTTARFIINKYRKNGTFPRRKLKRSKRKNGSAVNKIVNIPDAVENSEDKENKD